MSVFSISYWLRKGCTEEEAKHQIAIRRPNNVLYYTNKGYSISDAENLVKARQSKGGEKRKNMSSEDKRKLSPRCLEFYTARGYSLEEAKDKLKEFQTTFDKEICIKKYGVDHGTLIWEKRQKKWQDTLNSKSESEKEEINSKKNRWRNLSDEDATILKLQVSNKIKETVSNRPIEKTKEIFDRIVSSKIKAGQYMPRELLPAFEVYKRQVWRETRRNNLTILENFNLRGRKNFHLDHMYSIWQGFLGDTPPEIVGHICNLKMIGYRENLSKHISCTLTLMELQLLINKHNRA